MKSSLIGIAALPLLYCTVLNSAQAQNPVLVDISQCMDMTTDDERYACYDRLAQTVRASQNAASQQLPDEPANAEPVVVSSAKEPAPPKASPAPPRLPAASVAEFGQETPATTDSAKVVANDLGDDELHDRIASVQEREPGRRLITLESGQVWYQSNSERFRLVKGMAVRIYPSPLRGSYRLARDDGKETGFIQVERVK